MKKMSKTAKTIDKYLEMIQIGLGISFFGLALFSVVVIVAAFLKPELLNDFNDLAGVTVGFIDFDFNDKAQLNRNWIRVSTVFNSLFLTTSTAYVCWGTRIFRDMLKPIIDEQPFRSAVSNGLKKLSWVILFGGAVLFVIEAGNRFMFTQAYDLKKIFSKKLVEDYTVLYLPSMSFLLEFALLYMLSYVFKHGEELQQQADETL